MSDSEFDHFSNAGVNHVVWICTGTGSYNEITVNFK